VLANDASYLVAARSAISTRATRGLDGLERAGAAINQRPQAGQRQGTADAHEHGAVGSCSVAILKLIFNYAGRPAPVKG
jgi:hypothetical protein